MEKFEVDACRKWIEDNQFTVVALQVPDEDLDKVQDLIDQLTTTASTEQIEFFLVGDGCSPCCNDLINAQYCQAQGLIHFGHSCLTTLTDENSPKISIFYVFYQQPLSDEAFFSLSTERAKGDERYKLVFYDPCFTDAIRKYSVSETCPSYLIFSRLTGDKPHDPSLFSIYGRCVQLPLPLDPSNYTILFLSHSKASINNFALYFYAYEFHSCPTIHMTTQRLLSKRMYAIECARNGSSFGFLVSSNSLLNLPTTIHRLLDNLKRLLDKQQRSYYTFLMNTLSITKMNNFEQNIDIYVLCSSCCESLWLSPEHKQFNIPLVSVVDVFHAFDANDEQPMKTYSFDLREILSNIKPIIEDPEEEKREQGAIMLKHPNALLLQQRDGNDRGLNENRSWWGLKIDEKKDDEKEMSSMAELKEGRFGIASGYRNETSS